jgi:transposase
VKPKSAAADRLLIHIARSIRGTGISWKGVKTVRVYRAANLAGGWLLASPAHADSPTVYVFGQ